MSRKSIDNLLPPSEEAARYLDNARQILSEKARKEDGEYRDIKYVTCDTDAELHLSLNQY